jgi:hypothetical protein
VVGDAAALGDALVGVELPTHADPDPALGVGMFGAKPVLTVEGERNDLGPGAA